MKVHDKGIPTETIRKGALLAVIMAGIFLLGACSFFGLGGGSLSQEEIRATAAVLAETRVAQTAVIPEPGENPPAIAPTPTLNLEGCVQEDLIEWRDMATVEFEALQAQIETLYYGNPSQEELQGFYDGALAKEAELAEMDYSFCEPILLYHLQLIELYTNFASMLKAGLDGDTATFELEKKGFTKDLFKFNNLLLNLADEDAS
jgi:hypothetical protein